MLNTNVKLILRTLSILAVCFLAGCASNVRTTVSTFRSVELPPTNTTIKVLARETEGDEQLDVLEFDFFRQKLAQKFTEQGYQVVAEGEPSALVAYLQYDTQRQEKNRRSPTYIHGGYGFRYGYSSVVVIDSDDRERFEYLRRVKVSVFAKANTADTDSDTKALLSISAESRGQCQYLISVYDDMLTAIFQDPLRDNGSIITVPVRATRPCAGH